LSEGQEYDLAPDKDLAVSPPMFP